MQDLRVPTAKLETEVKYAGGRELSGYVFLPTISQHHSGTPRPEEWINQPNGFFPFLPGGSSAAVILNKDQVRQLSVRLTPDVAVAEEAEPFTCAVLVECGADRMEGTLRIDMPDMHSRVLDYVNRPEPFLPLWSDGWLHLIRKSCVTLIAETARS